VQPFLLRSLPLWLTTPNMNAPVNMPGRFDSLPRFASALKAIESLKPGDPLSIVVAALVLMGAAVLAALFPALRAARVEPMIALRSE